MLSLSCFCGKKPIQTFIATLFAMEVLHIYEDKHSGDLRPRRAIEESEKYVREGVVSGDIAKITKAVEHAYSSCRDNKAKSAADSAAFAIHLSGLSSRLTNFSSTADAAANAAFAAKAGAHLATGKTKFIHSVILKNLDKIIQLHIKEGIALRSPEEIFKWLSEEARKDFIFQMDILTSSEI